MGLDQFAYIRTEDSDGGNGRADFVWRKHSRLQTFMENLFVERTGRGSLDLNCGELMLEESDIDALETAVKENDLPRCPGGFFYGHQIQEQRASDYRDQDLAFCHWARGQLRSGRTVIYSCWW